MSSNASNKSTPSPSTALSTDLLRPLSPSSPNLTKRKNPDASPEWTPSELEEINRAASQIAAERTALIADFFEVDVFSQVLRANGFTLREELDICISIARDCEEATTRLAALRYLNMRQRQALELSGQVVHGKSVKLSRDKQGNVRVDTLTAKTLARDSNTLLEAATRGTYDAEKGYQASALTSHIRPSSRSQERDDGDSSADPDDQHRD
jgi:hypothetical protein